MIADKFRWQKSLSSKKIGILAQRLCEYTQHSREERIEREKEEAEAEKRASELAERERIAEEAERKAAAAAEAEREAAEKLVVEQQTPAREQSAATRHGLTIWSGVAISLLALILIFRKKDREE